MFKDECIKIKFIIKFLRININPTVFLGSLINIFIKMVKTENMQ